MKHLKHVILIGGALLICQCTPHSPTPKDFITQKVDSILSTMSLAAKVGQLNQLRGTKMLANNASNTEVNIFDEVKAGKVGTMLNVWTLDDQMLRNGKITASVEITNTGQYDGTEIVQLYIQDLVATVTRATQQLKGFQKVFIKKGETKEVQFDITIDALKYWDADMNYTADPGEFRLMIGTSSSTYNAVNFKLTDYE